MSRLDEDRAVDRYEAALEHRAWERDQAEDDEVRFWRLESQRRAHRAGRHADVVDGCPLCRQIAEQAA